MTTKGRRYRGVRLMGRCEHCGMPLPLLGPHLSVRCAHCHEENRFSAEHWAVLIEELDRSPRTTEFRDLEVDVKVEEPPSTLEVTDVPGWLKGLVPTARRLHGVRPAEEEPRAVGPVVMSCPQCAAPVELNAASERLTTCGHCRASVYLPDEYWRRLHPVKKAERWFIELKGEGAKKPPPPRPSPEPPPGVRVRHRSRPGATLFLCGATAGPTLAMLLTLYLGREAVRPSWHIPPVSSLVLAHLIPAAALLLLLALVIAVVVYQRRSARARAAQYDNRLSPGDGRVLYGQVVAAEDPIRIVIKQKEFGQDHTEWREVERRVSAARFRLQLASGERVLVEPGSRPTLITDIGSKRGFSHTQGNTKYRHTSVGLSPDQPAYAVGKLSTERTEHGPAWVLRSKAMLISTLPLDVPYKRKNRRMVTAAIFTAVFLLACIPLLFEFYQGHYLGRTVQVEVVSKHQRDWMDTDAVFHHERIVGLRIMGGPHAGFDLSRDVDQTLFSTLREGQKLPARMVVGSPKTARMGAGATLHIFVSLTMLCCLFVALMLTYVAFFRPVGWWDGPLKD